MSELDTLIGLAKSGDAEGIRALVATNPILVTERLPSGESPLMAALYLGHHTVVETLIELGTDVDVFAAAAAGRAGDLARCLADPTAVNAYAYDGWTPLHLAAFFGHLDAARLLVESGADVHAVSQNSLKNTPLHAATAGKHANVAMLLLAHGANGFAVDAGDYTPLDIARQNGLTGVVAAISRDNR